MLMALEKEKSKKEFSAEEHLEHILGVHVQDLHAVEATNWRVPNAPSRLLLLALLYTSIKASTG